MVRRARIMGWSVGAVLIAGACATSPGSLRGSRFDAAPSDRFIASGTDVAAVQDSIAAQAVADREGPRVSLYAELGWAAGAKQVTAHFRLDDDAYVLIGHIDGDGVVRIVFPTNPRDDGFVQGQKSYSTAPLFTGFADQYAFRYQQGAGLLGRPASYQSYDGGLGYLFIVASWRPMRFDRFASENGWDSFELAEQDYLNDPKPAIDEMAALLAGANREAYTVQFARYFASQYDASYDMPYSAYGDGFGYCAGYEPFGYADSPFLFSPFSRPVFPGFGAGYYGASQFYYQGTEYEYDVANDCYRTYPGAGFGSGYYYYPFGFITPPTTVPFTPRRAGLTPQPPRPPLHPVVPLVHLQPVPQAQDAQTPSRFSNEYRVRGLMTADDPTPHPVRPRPGRLGTPDAGAGAAPAHRPTIEQMTARHAGDASDGGTTNPWRAHNGARGMTPAGSAGGARPAPRNTPHTAPHTAPRSAPHATSHGRPPAMTSSPQHTPPPRPSISESRPGRSSSGGRRPNH